MTDPADRQRLLRIAREAIAAHLNKQSAPKVDISEAPRGNTALAQPGSAFVTLYAEGRLRGCIGDLQSDRLLGQVVAYCAVAACSRDPRFPAVTAAELSRLLIELSILGALEPVASLDEIEVGRHGLVVEQGWRRGLLLPQVAIEWRWDRRVFAGQACHKAGLPADAWEQGATLWRFEAEVFAEREK